MSSAREPLFLVKPDHGLVEISPGAPDTEADLQALIAEYPRLIGDPEDSLMLVRREQDIPDQLDGVGRWSIDHVFVSRSAVPVLVEVKRATDTRLRREVVGQMLDYAANGVTYWPAGTLRAQFEKRVVQEGGDPDMQLAQFLGEGQDPPGFWSRVDDNLRTGRVTLLFVADVIPRELAKVVEFMNDQMRADVRAVELQYFVSPDGSRLIAPRVVGETERTRAEKATARPRPEPITTEQFFEQFLAPKGPAVVQGGKVMLEILRSCADEVGVTSAQGSIFSRVAGPGGRSSYPLFITVGGRGQIAFGYLSGSQELATMEPRQEFHAKFAEAVGGLSNANVKGGFPSFMLDRLADPPARRPLQESPRSSWPPRAGKLHPCRRVARKPAL